MHKMEGSIVKSVFVVPKWRVLLFVAQTFETVLSEIQSHFETSCWFFHIFLYFPQKTPFLWCLRRFSLARYLQSRTDHIFMRKSKLEAACFHFTLAYHQRVGFNVHRGWREKFFNFFVQMLQQGASKTSLSDVIGYPFSVFLKLPSLQSFEGSK